MVSSVRHYKEQNAKDETIDMRIFRWMKRKIRNDRIRNENVLESYNGQANHHIMSHRVALHGMPM